MPIPLRKRRDKKNAPPDEVRCGALLRDCYGNQTDEQCWSRATVAIDGREFCAKHGSARALQLMLEAGTAKIIRNTTMKPVMLLGEIGRQQLHYEAIGTMLVRREGMLRWFCPACERRGESKEVLRQCPKCNSLGPKVQHHSV